MSITTWILSRLQGLNAAVSRSDLPPRDSAREPRLGPVVAEPVASRADHLGAYAPLIDAIREELEHFVASHVRLHLAIADRDRFLLTSIGIGCPGAEAARDLLQRFVHEFKPEQVKRYLAREVIGGLPNAAAIDLSQFAGLFDADLCEAAAEEARGDDYHELLSALRDTPAAPTASAYEVSILGRWTEAEAAAAASPTARHGAAPGDTLTTPLAGPRCEFDVEDASGRRRVVLQGVVAGRRYVVGSGDGCDIRVDGTYTSRRHAELWLDGGAWWVADAGSTNGVRVEASSGLIDPARSAPDAARGEATRLDAGSRLVLSARNQGAPSEYPSLALRPLARAASMATPIAALSVAAVRTPRTAILPPRPVVSSNDEPPVPLSPRTEVLAVTEAMPPYRITVSQAAGVQTVDLHRRLLPVTVGRSRNQTLVVDRQHEGVSGHHLDVVELDASGARVIVHGDNGVSLDGVMHPPGTQLRWPVGATMVLDACGDERARCALVLTRAATN